MEDFDYETYKQKKIEKAIKEKLEDNIFIKQEKVKINRKYYDVKKKGQAKALDERFKRMYTDKDFEMRDGDK